MKSPNRLPAIDLLRGLVIALMALDHVRDFFAPTAFDPMDLALTTPGWFWTRWITHLCAPTFVLLAGSSAFLRAQKYAKPAMSRYLFSRGLLLVLLEVTLINFSWQFGFNNITLQVMWALGVGMMALALLIWLPHVWIGIVAACLILPHNLLDSLHSEHASVFLKVWHQGGWVGLTDDLGLFFLYPLMPWIGLMAAGYALGPVFLFKAKLRQSIFLSLSFGLMLLFIGLRLDNLYGDPDPWAVQEGGWLWNLMSFVRVHKYPPSLLYLAVTLSISFLLLALFDRYAEKELPVLSLFGRHPLFFYSIHVGIIHALAWSMMQIVYQQQPHWQNGAIHLPAGFEPSLQLCYAVWLAILALMFFLVRWWEQFRRRTLYIRMLK